jgi:hypothetical protein
MKRGTICKKEQVLTVMEDLYRRLPLLLKDRADWSNDPSRAYPTTIRLTARSSFASTTKSKANHNRRFANRSQQTKLDGRSLCNNALSESEAAAFLRRSVTPLLESLLFTLADINVTRLNICVSNFQDVVTTSTATQQLLGRPSIFEKDLSSSSRNQCRKTENPPDRKRFRTAKDL